MLRSDPLLRGNQGLPPRTGPIIREKMTWLDWMTLVVLSALWGGSFLFMEIAVREVAPLTIVASRIFLASLSIGLYVALRGGSLRFPLRIWGMFFGIGLFHNVIAFSLIAWAQTEITASLASILNATVPFFTILVAHSLTHDEKLKPRRVAGVLIGFLGVVVIIGPDALQDLGMEVVAQGAVLIAAFLYALSTVLCRQYTRLGIPPLSAAAGQMTAAAVMGVPLALILDRPWEAALPSYGALGALMGLGLLSTGVAFVLYFHLISRAGANNTVLTTFLIPVSAITLSVLLLGEPVVPAQIAGMAVIGLGLIVIDGRLVRLARAHLRALRT